MTDHDERLARIEAKLDMLIQVLSATEPEPPAAVQINSCRVCGPSLPAKANCPLCHGTTMAAG